MFVLIRQDYDTILAPTKVTAHGTREDAVRAMVADYEVVRAERTDTDEDGYEWHDFSDDSSWYDEQAMTARLVDRYGEGSYWRVFEV